MKIDRVNLGQLKLDPQNPRLPSDLERSQNSMLEYLAKSSSIEELMSAISENDFFEAEALIAVPDDGGLVVVEGNRRLTALRLLSGETYPDISPRVVELQRTAKHRPKKVPVAIYDSRSEVLNYLGNRHIAGVKPWGALAKARYIRQLFDQTSKADSFVERTRTVASVIGSRRDFISKSMKAYSLYESAVAHNFFGLPLDEGSIRFSLISTAIDYEGVQNFVYGPDARDSDGSLSEPIQDRLKEFFQWVFVKDRDGKVRLGESRNILKLSKIMLSDDGLRAFRAGASIDQAYLYTTGVNEDFDMICLDVQRSLREANSLVADVKPSSERASIADSIVRHAAQLASALKS